MKVKKVTRAENPWYIQYHVWFTNGNAIWSKDFPENIGPEELKEFINSVIEDTKIHGKETKVG